IDQFFNASLGPYSWGGTYALNLTGETRIWPISWIPPWGYANASIVAHEMGHSFGLPHSSGDYGCPYDNQWDVMSYDRINCHLSRDPAYQCLGQHTIANHLSKLGWLTGESIATAPEGTNNQLYPLEQLALPQSPGFLMVKVPIGGSATHYYTAEVRRRV